MSVWMSHLDVVEPYYITNWLGTVDFKSTMWYSNTILGNYTFFPVGTIKILRWGLSRGEPAFTAGSRPAYNAGGELLGVLSV